MHHQNEPGTSNNSNSGGLLQSRGSLLPLPGIQTGSGVTLPLAQHVSKLVPTHSFTPTDQVKSYRPSSASENNLNKFEPLSDFTYPCQFDIPDNINLSQQGHYESSNRQYSLDHHRLPTGNYHIQQTYSKRPHPSNHKHPFWRTKWGEGSNYSKPKPPTEIYKILTGKSVLLKKKHYKTDSEVNISNIRTTELANSLQTKPKHSKPSDPKNYQECSAEIYKILTGKSVLLKKKDYKTDSEENISNNRTTKLANSLQTDSNHSKPSARENYQNWSVLINVGSTDVLNPILPKPNIASRTSKQFGTPSLCPGDDFADPLEAKNATTCDSINTSPSIKKPGDLPNDIPGKDKSGDKKTSQVLNSSAKPKRAKVEKCVDPENLKVSWASLTPSEATPKMSNGIKRSKLQDSFFEPRSKRPKKSLNAKCSKLGVLSNHPGTRSMDSSYAVRAKFNESLKHGEKPIKSLRNCSVTLCGSATKIPADKKNENFDENLKEIEQVYLKHGKAKSKNRIDSKISQFGHFPPHTSKPTNSMKLSNNITKKRVTMKTDTMPTKPKFRSKALLPTDIEVLKSRNDESVKLRESSLNRKEKELNKHRHAAALCDAIVRPPASCSIETSKIKNTTSSDVSLKTEGQNKLKYSIKKHSELSDVSSLLKSAGEDESKKPHDLSFQLEESRPEKSLDANIEVKQSKSDSHSSNAKAVKLCDIKNTNPRHFSLPPKECEPYKSRTNTKLAEAPLKEAVNKIPCQIELSKLNGIFFKPEGTKDKDSLQGCPDRYEVDSNHFKNYSKVSQDTEITESKDTSPKAIKDDLNKSLGAVGSGSNYASVKLSDVSSFVKSAGEDESKKPHDLSFPLEESRPEKSLDANIEVKQSKSDSHSSNAKAVKLCDIKNTNPRHFSLPPNECEPYKSRTNTKLAEAPLKEAVNKIPCQIELSKLNGLFFKPEGTKDKDSLLGCSNRYEVDSNHFKNYSKVSQDTEKTESKDNSSKAIKGDLNKTLGAVCSGSNYASVKLLEIKSLKSKYNENTEFDMRNGDGSWGLDIKEAGHFEQPTPYVMKHNVSQSKNSIASVSLHDQVSIQKIETYGANDLEALHDQVSIQTIGTSDTNDLEEEPKVLWFVSQKPSYDNNSERLPPEQYAWKSKLKIGGIHLKKQQPSTVEKAFDSVTKNSQPENAKSPSKALKLNHFTNSVKPSGSVPNTQVSNVDCSTPSESTPSMPTAIATENSANFVKPFAHIKPDPDFEFNCLETNEYSATSKTIVLPEDEYRKESPSDSDYVSEVFPSPSPICYSPVKPPEEGYAGFPIKSISPVPFSYESPLEF